ncbi:MAG: beta-ketoacyl synthase N-terminal-like domain-containing protein, partial [Rhodospirillaceae bacterium]
MGGTRELAAVFSDEVCALGKRIARERHDGGCLVEVERPASAPPKLAGNTVFSFPGQGSFDLKLLRELSQEAGAHELLSAAEAIVQETLGVSLRRLVDASEDESAKLLGASPDLDQFGIILTELMLARRLAAQGIVPSAVIGHSFGEIAALCVAGCFPPDVAMRVVAERVRALRQVGGPAGGMMALTAPLARAKEVLAEIDTRAAVTVSVVNDPKQTVVSGPRDYLDQLVPEFAKRRIGARVLASRYAFHSPGLASAARTLVMGLIPLPFGAPTIPAYSPIVGRFYDKADALPIALSSHLTRPIDFPQAMQALVASGMTRIIECRAGGVLTAIVKRNGLEQVEALSATDALAAPQTPAAIEKRLEPIAIVSMGAVLPGAKDIEAFWGNLIDGTSGIVDLRTLDPVVGADLIGGAQTAVIADKSYSALAGYAADVPWRQDYPFTTGAFAAMSKAQRLLAEALRQARLPGGDKQADRTLCLLGSTADGIAEYDDALHGAVVRHVLDELKLPAALKAATRQALDGLLPPGDPEAAGPYPTMSAIVGPMLGESVQTVMLDAACASSLYALDLGVQALRAGEADLVYAGGVFAPGPSGSALFSQFGGLSTTGSHALDKSADGVVFGEGAAILGLRRLSDAVARGETIHAVVTASALSSDGHSVAINVPRAEGQRKAMEAAYRASGIDPQSVQCVEAHATATPVGDATEFKALTAVYGGRDASLPRIKLGSVKSLLGHTGWLAGAASVIKVIESMKRGVLPPHHGWTAPGTGIDLAASPFDIVTKQQPWPDRPGVPRRAAINGFGFGGTNAHVVIEAFDPKQAVAVQPVGPPDIVCVGFGAAFPGSADSFADRAGGRAATINTAPFRLPRRKLLMPDALDQMDTAQFTVLASADRALERAKLDLAQWKERTGIVIGSAGKARRGVAAIQRVLADRLHRKLSAALVEAGQDAKSAATVCDALVAQLKVAGGKPSNAYTLVGMMPNLVAGRASNVFDFSGPSVVVDTGRQSLIAAMRVAQSYLNHRVCDVILAGGVNTTAPWPRAGLPVGDDGVEPDGATLLVLMRRETAIANKLPILASVTASADELSIVPTAGGEAKQTDVPLGRPHEVSGIAALADCLHAASPQRFRWSRRNDAATAAQMGYLRDPRPISFYERIAVPAPVMASGVMPRRVLLVTDQPALAGKLQQLPAFAGSQIRCLVPPGNDEKTVSAIDTSSVDLLLVARDLKDVAPSALLDPKVDPTAVLDLAFLAVRHLHEQIAEGRVKLLALNLGAWPNGTLHPDAALLHGMLKSLARDWPAATVRALATESSDPAAAAVAVGRELACADSDVEIVEVGGQRHALRFARAM